MVSSTSVRAPGTLEGKHAPGEASVALATRMPGATPHRPLRAEHGGVVPAPRMTAPATFSLYVRSLPSQRGFAVGIGTLVVPRVPRGLRVRRGGAGLPGRDRVRRSSARGLRERAVRGRGARGCRGEDRPRRGADPGGDRADRRRAARGDLPAQPGDAPHDPRVEGRPLRAGRGGAGPGGLRVPPHARPGGGGRGRAGQRARRVRGDLERGGRAAPGPPGRRDDGARVHRGVPHRGRGLPGLRRGPSRAHHVPRGHLRHRQRGAQRDRDDRGARARGRRSASGWTAATSITSRARPGRCSTRRG